jgi:hypothetical protein
MAFDLTPFTQRVYKLLPAFMRTTDREDIAARFIGVVGDEADGVRALKDRLAYTPEQGGTSELTDPAFADTAWLPWLGQLVGLDVTVLDRDIVTNGAAGWQVGRREALRSAVARVFTGGGSFSIYTHSTAAVGARGTATQWDLLLITRGSETPNPAAVLVAASTVKPAGVKLYHRTYQAPWSEYNALTWAGWNSRTWAQLAEIGLD